MVGNNHCAKDGESNHLDFMKAELERLGIKVPKKESDITRVYCTRCCKTSYVC